ncbi:MAG: hypothetical protein ABEH64_10390, partial [Salinirussus sp.]
MMDLDQLQSVRDRERRTDDLQELREEFYREAAAFVRDLRAERAAAAEDADDPFDSPTVNRLTDRIRTAEQTIEAIFEKRVSKVVRAATFAAADMSPETEGMTAEEVELFEMLTDGIEAHRDRVLGRLETAAEEVEDPLPETEADSAPSAERDEDSAPEPPPPPEPDPETDDVERELVRITDDVGAILGVDEREYELVADDVVDVVEALDAFEF